MATRAPSKIMSIADKKIAQAGLKTAMTNHNANIKSISAELKAADKALADQTKAALVAKKNAAADLAAQKKAADAAYAAANKAAAALEKGIEANLARAAKEHAAAKAKADKALAAAAKGTDKLTSQMAAIEATPSEAPAAKAAKTKASAPAPEAA